MSLVHFAIKSQFVCTFHMRHAIVFWSFKVTDRHEDTFLAEPYKYFISK